jgi:hypothetical protein
VLRKSLDGGITDLKLLERIFDAVSVRDLFKYLDEGGKNLATHMVFADMFAAIDAVQEGARYSAPVYGMEVMQSLQRKLGTNQIATPRLDMLIKRLKAELKKDPRSLRSIDWLAADQDGRSFLAYVRFCNEGTALELHGLLNQGRQLDSKIWLREYERLFEACKNYTSGNNLQPPTASQQGEHRINVRTDEKESSDASQPANNVNTATVGEQPHLVTM